MTKEERNAAQNLIDNLPQYTLFSLTELYGDDWSKISDPRNFGKSFKKAVGNNSLTNISHQRIRSTGRCDEYIKT